MWRIYTKKEILDSLHKEHNVHTFCGPDMEIYVCDFMFSMMIKYLNPDGFTEFRAEFVSDSEYTAMCDSYDFNPSLTSF